MLNHIKSVFYVFSSNKFLAIDLKFTVFSNQASNEQLDTDDCQEDFMVGTNKQIFIGNKSSTFVFLFCLRRVPKVCGLCTFGNMISSPPFWELIRRTSIISSMQLLEHGLSPSSSCFSSFNRYGMHLFNPIQLKKRAIKHNRTDGQEAENKSD